MQIGAFMRVFKALALFLLYLFTLPDNSRNDNDIHSLLEKNILRIDSINNGFYGKKILPWYIKQ